MLLEWHASEVPDGLVVTQIYGFIVDRGRILLQDDDGRFNLPGGKPENDESQLETLCREAMEESQVEIADASYLGYQRVVEDDGTEYAQVRYVARLSAVHPRCPDPATGGTYRRLLAVPGEVVSRLGWWETGAAQLASALTAATRFGEEVADARYLD